MSARNDPMDLNLSQLECGEGSNCVTSKFQFARGEISHVQGVVPVMQSFIGIIHLSVLRVIIEIAYNVK